MPLCSPLKSGFPLMVTVFFSEDGFCWGFLPVVLTIVMIVKFKTEKYV